MTRQSLDFQPGLFGPGSAGDQASSRCHGGWVILWAFFVVFFPGCFVVAEVGVVDFSGQIIATSHDQTPNGGLVWEIPLFQGNLGW